MIKLTTNDGPIVIELDPQQAPLTCANVEDVPEEPVVIQRAEILA